jgi:ATP-dependent DNA helicase RecG
VPVTPSNRTVAFHLPASSPSVILVKGSTNDGFEIAEADLKLRGPGDLEGTQQSGIAFDLKIADIARDGQLLQYVREVAQTIVDKDPNGSLPENEILWRQLKALRKTNVNWAAIS